MEANEDLIKNLAVDETPTGGIALDRVRQAVTMPVDVAQSQARIRHDSAVAQWARRAHAFRRSSEEGTGRQETHTEEASSQASQEAAGQDTAAAQWIR
jgi:hypothetical protein